MSEPQPEPEPDFVPLLGDLDNDNTVSGRDLVKMLTHMF